MGRGAVTFDFHDTLARCDGWFELEVRGLVPAFLRWWAGERNEDVGAETIEEGAAAYRRLRLEIVEHGRELPAEACVARVLERMGVGATGEEIGRGVEALMREQLHEVAPVAGAMEAVRALAGAGVALGVVSSAVYHPFLEWTLGRFGVLDLFGVVTTSASAGFYKSRPEIFSTTLAALGAEAGRSVHVGDSFRFDVAGARRAGMRTVWLRKEGVEVPGEESADLTVSRMGGLAPRVLELIGA